MSSEDSERHQELQENTGVQSTSKDATFADGSTNEIIVEPVNVSASEPSIPSTLVEMSLGPQPVASVNMSAMPVNSDTTTREKNTSEQNTALAEIDRAVQLPISDASSGGESPDTNENKPDPAGSHIASDSIVPNIKSDPESTEAEHPLAQHPTAASASSPATKQEANIKTERTSTSPPEAPKEVSLDGLRQVASSRDLAVLETGVTATSAILKKLRKYMADFKEHENILKWLHTVVQLQSKTKTAGRTVVAVAGATGAGKSSLINAILNEEILLPTNGMRACTAVITEICYNYDQDPQKAYRAEVEFISQEQWTSELNLLFEELLDDSASWRDPDSEAGVAYAKVKAVYPGITHEDLLETNPENMSKVADVSKVLGTKEYFSFSTAAQLHSTLSRFLDSKEKGSKSTEMALWPIIRVVRIFTRADALSTNVCLVDLPGTLDSNAARSAVAIKYMAECTSVWVAARISRAVDDRAAKDLLGRSSRIQMKLDGVFSHLSFIATQTDGINIEETIRSLGDDEQIQASLAQEEELNATIVEKTTKLRKLEKQFNDLDEAYNGLVHEERTWTALQKKHKRQKVYAPAAPSQGPSPKKRRRKTREQLDDGDLDQSNKVPLTSNEISVHLEELEASLETIGVECDEAEKDLTMAGDEVSQLKQQKVDCAVDRAWMCVQKRNRYVREGIRRDFAAGIREIDEEDDHSVDDKEDEVESCRPSVQKRDYEKVAQALSVFCISSKAYQQQRKTTQRRTLQTEGFRDLESTGIPSLQEHAKASSREGQIRSNKAYLNQFSKLLNSLTIWSRHELSGQTEERVAEYELRYLESRMSQLQERFNERVFELRREILDTMREAFSNKMSGAAQYASRLLEGTIAKWSTPEKDGGCGLKVATYRAICRRHGHKTTPKGREFNEEIIEPYLMKISSSWDESFAVTIPAALAKFSKRFTEDLRGFHNLMLSRTKVKPSVLRNLEVQLETHEATISDAINIALMRLQADQREASRMFLPEIEKAMTEVYDECAQQKGRGCYNRIKETMNQFGRDNKKVIFKKAGKGVNKNLQKAFGAVINSLLEDTENIRDTLSNDYKLVLPRVDDGLQLVREEIRDILHQADIKFETIFCSAAAEATSADISTEQANMSLVKPGGPAGSEVDSADTQGEGEAMVVDS